MKLSPSKHRLNPSLPKFFPIPCLTFLQLQNRYLNKVQINSKHFVNGKSENSNYQLAKEMHWQTFLNKSLKKLVPKVLIQQKQRTCNFMENKLKYCITKVPKISTYNYNWIYHKIDSWFDISPLKKYKEFIIHFVNKKKGKTHKCIINP